MLNLEIKVRIDNLAEIAEILGAFFIEELFQTDTYFVTKKGSRLKLREQKGKEPYIIRYDREDIPGEKFSNYVFYRIGDFAAFMEVFQDALTAELVIIKKRSLYLIDNARVHLDQVDSLGSFLEIEVLIENETQRRSAPALLQRILKLVNLGNVEGIDCGYRELKMKSKENN